MKGPNKLRFSDGSQNPKIMEIKIQISDRAYAQLLNSNKRLKGSIGLVSPTEGNFNVYQRHTEPKPGTKYMRLPHGRVTVSDEDVRMSLHIRRDENRLPAQAIRVESYMLPLYL